jgi:hypothetical protein
LWFKNYKRKAKCKRGEYYKEGSHRQITSVEGGKEHVVFGR